MNPDDENSNFIHGVAPDALEHLLATYFTSDGEMTPSSGFPLSVIEALQAETSTPPPIPFPWLRVAPVLSVTLCITVTFFVLALREMQTISAPDTGSQHSFFSHGLLLQMNLTPLEQALCWIATAMCLSITVVASCMRLTTSSSKMGI